jgi:hypothetical protein
MPYVAYIATASLTPGGHGADAPEPILRPSPATGHEADILDAEDPCLGYDADTVPSVCVEVHDRPDCQAVGAVMHLVVMSGRRCVGISPGQG